MYLKGIRNIYERILMLEEIQRTQKGKKENGECRVAQSNLENALTLCYTIITRSGSKEIRMRGGVMERKEYYEINLPPYLQHDLDAMKEGKYPYDCLWGELYGSINSAFVDGNITEEQAWYLRETYLNMERG